MSPKPSIPRWRLLLLGIVCLLVASPLHLQTLSLNGEGWRSYEFISRQAGTSAKPMDLDADGRGDCVSLTRGSVAIHHCDDPDGAELWQSPSGWQVKDWTYSDLNHDGLPEVTLLVWKRYVPWPVDRFLPEGGGRTSGFHDSRGDSCHVILIGWQNHEFRELWAGSALHDPALALEAADIDADGIQELITVEGRYQDSSLWRSGPLAIWKWNGFGFDLYQRLDGAFRQVQVLAGSPGWMVVSQ